MQSPWLFESINRKAGGPCPKKLSSFIKNAFKFIRTRLRDGFAISKPVFLIVAYTIYFLLPWLRWDRPNAPDQAVLYDLPGRHFYIFGLTIQVQDIFWLAGVLIIFAILLFFVTGLARRVWCGYFCFQTLWTDLFMMIERWVQGERPARMRLDKGPWNREKIVKRGVQWYSM